MQNLCLDLFWTFAYTIPPPHQFKNKQTQNTLHKSQLCPCVRHPALWLGDVLLVQVFSPLFLRFSCMEMQRGEMSEAGWSWCEPPRVMPGVMPLPSPHWVYLCPPKPITVEIPCLEITPCPPILEWGRRDSWGQTPLHGTHYHEKGAVQAENPLLTPRTPPEHPGVMGRGQDQPKGAAGQRPWRTSASCSDLLPSRLCGDLVTLAGGMICGLIYFSVFVFFPSVAWERVKGRTFFCPHGRRKIRGIADKMF